MYKKPEVKTCKYVEVYDLVPKEWGDWFFDIVFQDEPFSFNDNSFSLVGPSAFADHCQKRLSSIWDNDEMLPITRKELDEWLKMVREIDSEDPVYINME